MNPWKPLVLVVDDDANVRRILCHHLQASNYETIEAKNGREALDCVHKFKPDAILLDIMMPLIDGFKVCEYIKGDPQTRHIRVVVLTARGKKDDVVAAVKAGADDYIVKPFTKEVVLDRLKKVLAAREAVTGAPSTASGDRRENGRAARPATISWSSRNGDRIHVTFKEQVLDISTKGLAFEHVRCETCTGYEKDGVHPQCPFWKNAKRNRESEPVEFIVTLPIRKIIKVQGKVAHVYQPSDLPRTEKVGVTFTSVSPEVLQIIKDYISQNS